jgi:hypothetical protein
MGFEVRPAPIRGGRGRPAAAIVGALFLAAVVVAAVNVDAPGQEATAAGSAAPSASAEPTIRKRPLPAYGVEDWARLLPFRTTCHELDQPDCRRALAAAMEVLREDVPAVAIVDVWPGISCGDTLDCPPQRLDRTIPLANVVVRFADGGPPAKVNVVRASPLAGGPSPTRVEAWIVSWAP